MKSKLLSTSNMAKIAILSAIAFILMYFEFPLPFIAPPFYKIDFSEIPVLIGGFAISPMAAIIIELLKNVMNLLFEGSMTAGVGELSNFIVGVVFVYPASHLYWQKKDRKTALKSLVLGTLTMTVIGFISNLFFVIPAYVQFANLPLSAIVGMGNAIFPFVNNTFDLVLFCTTPFNLLKGIMISVIVMVVYKHISPLIKA